MTLMNVSKNLKIGAYVLMSAMVFTACSSDDADPVANEGTLKISARASYNNSVGRMSVNAVNESVNVTSFLVNFKEIELERVDADDDDSNNMYGSDDDVELQGPFIIDLMSGINTPLVNISIPNGIYKEIEFEFDKSTDNDSPMLGKSIKMSGEINGTPFVFWHDFEEEIEIDYEDSNTNLVIDNNANEIVINFNLTAVVGPTGSVDITTATDNDGDGIITISPNDQDGNNQLAQALKEAIKAQIELLEDED